MYCLCPGGNGAVKQGTVEAPASSPSKSFWRPLQTALHALSAGDRRTASSTWHWREDQNWRWNAPHTPKFKVAAPMHYTHTLQPLLIRWLINKVLLQATPNRDIPPMMHTSKHYSLPLARRCPPRGPSRSSRVSPPPAKSAAGLAAAPRAAPAPDSAGLDSADAPAPSAAAPAAPPPAPRARAPHSCPVTRRPNPAALAASSRVRAPWLPAAAAPGSGPSNPEPSASGSPAGSARPPGRCCRCSRSSPFSRLPALPNRRAALRERIQGHERRAGHTLCSSPANQLSLGCLF